MNNYLEFLQIAHAFSKNNEPIYAIIFYTKVLTLNPECAEAYEDRAHNHFSILEIDKAITDYTLAIQYNPENDKAYANRGEIYLNKKKLVLALYDFETAHALNKTHPYYIEVCAYLNLFLKNAEKAIEYCSLLLKQDANNLSALLYIADAYFQLEKYQDAIKYYSLCLQPEIIENNVHTYNNIGFAYAKLNKHREAIEWFNKCININENHAYAYNNRGYSKFVLGDYDEGLNDVNHSLLLDPSNAYAYKNRGKMHKKFGETAQAIMDFNKARELMYTEKFDNELDELLREILN